MDTRLWMLNESYDTINMTALPGEAAYGKGSVESLCMSEGLRIRQHIHWGVCLCVVSMRRGFPVLEHI